MYKKILFSLFIGILFSCVNQKGLNNNSESIAFQPILTQYMLRNYTEVITLLNQIESTKENDLVGLNYLYGLCYMNENMNQLSRIYFFKVLKVYPDNYEILNNIGVTYFQDSDYLNAMKYFHLSYLTNTNYTIALDNYNTSFLNYNNHQDDSKRLGIIPFADDVINYNTLGWFYYYQSDYINAIYYFKKAIDADNKYQFAYISLGYIYDETKNFFLALDYLKKAEVIDPNNPDLQNNLGVLYFHLGMVEESELSFKKAIKLNNFFAEPYSNLGLLYYFKQDYQQSKEMLLKSVNLNTYNPDLLAESYSVLAIISQKNNNIEAAKKYKLKAIESSYKIKDIAFLSKSLQWSEDMIALWIEIEY